MNNKQNKLKKEILEFKIPYRNNIKFLDNDTFGCEIEFCEADFNSIQNDILSLQKENRMKHWYMQYDETVFVHEPQNYLKGKGGEVCSAIISEKDKNFDEIKIACDIIKKHGGVLNHKTAGHIHVGGQMFNSKEIVDKFLLLWSIFEDIIERFFCGEFLENSYLNYRAKNCRNSFISSNYDLYELRKYRNEMFKETNYDKSLHPITWAVNFYKFYYCDYEYENTIEFRKICGTLEPEIWQNNVYFLSKFIDLCNKISVKELEYIKKSYDYSIHDKIDLNKAIFLSNLVFEKELDKMCFLKQYLKDFHTENIRDKRINLVR